MQGYQHLLLGTVAGVCAASAIAEPAAGAAFAMACMVGSVYPDIDVASSKIGKKVKPLAVLANKVFGHRGFIHTPINGIFLYFLIFGITNRYLPSVPHCIAEGFTLGFFLHLIQDTFTKGGIMWFYPVSSKKMRLARIGSNSPWCFVITVILAALVAGFFLWFVPTAQMPELL